MIFKRTSTDICVSFECMNDDDEKSLAEALYIGVKEIRNIRVPYINWKKYAEEHHLFTILNYLRVFHDHHPIYCNDWDKAIWEVVFEERKREQDERR